MIFEKLRALIVETLEIDEDEITLEATFDDLGLDSLDIVELIMAAEDEFDISIGDDVLENINTVEDVVDLLTDLIG